MNLKKLMKIKDGFDLNSFRKNMEAKKKVNGELVADSEYMNDMDIDWLKAEVEHWYYDTDVVQQFLDEEDQRDIGYVTELIADMISRDNDVYEHGFTDEVEVTTLMGGKKNRSDDFVGNVWVLVRDILKNEHNF